MASHAQRSRTCLYLFALGHQRALRNQFWGLSGSWAKTRSLFISAPLALGRDRLGWDILAGELAAPLQRSLLLRSIFLPSDRRHFAVLHLRIQCAGTLSRDARPFNLDPRVRFCAL